MNHEVVKDAIFWEKVPKSIHPLQDLFWFASNVFIFVSIVHVNSRIKYRRHSTLVSIDLHMTRSDTYTKCNVHKIEDWKFRTVRGDISEKNWTTFREFTRTTILTLITQDSKAFTSISGKNKTLHYTDWEIPCHSRY